MDANTPPTTTGAPPDDPARGADAHVQPEPAEPDADITEESLGPITEAIDALTDLDPADAAGPGAAIADALSRLLEEEER